MSSATAVADAGSDECVVSTLAGGGQGRKTVDGFGEAAAFDQPFSLHLGANGSSQTNGGAAAGDGNSLILLQIPGYWVRRIHLPQTRDSISQLTQTVTAGLVSASPQLSDIPPLIDIIVAYVARYRAEVVTIGAACHNGQITRVGLDSGTPPPPTVRCIKARALCPDPHNTNGWFIANSHSVCHCDGKVVTFIAGSVQSDVYGVTDDIGENARFFHVSGMICTSDRRALYLSDCSNHRLRMIDIATRRVSTVAHTSRLGEMRGNTSFRYPKCAVFDRSRSIEPESAVWLVASGPLVRFDLNTRWVTTTVSVDLLILTRLSMIDSTPSGIVILTDLRYLRGRSTHQKSDATGRSCE